MIKKLCDNILHKLEDGCHITQSSTKENQLILRDKYCSGLAVIELFQDKIIHVRGYKTAEFPTKYIPSIIKFIRDYHYQINTETAYDLGLSIVRIEGQEELYLTSSELTTQKLNKFMRNPKKVNLVLNGFKKSTLVVPKTTQSCNLNLSHADIKKLIISKRANALIDMRDNMQIDSIMVGEGFIGSINLSRSSISDIRIQDNCRCNLTINYSAKCFNLKINDVYSGVLDIKDSCFHRLEIGYYCYANIKLSENWGQKQIKIGSSFRGNLIVDSVYVKDIVIGDDCKGKIFIKNKEKHEKGIKHIDLADDFGGELDICGSKTVERVDIGNNASGHINISGCESVRALRVNEYYDGFADLSHSGIMYIRAKKGSEGRMVLMDCSNLTLLKFSKDSNPIIDTDKTPLEIAKDENNVYYKFHHQKIPDEYFAPLYARWVKKVKNFFHRSFH